MRHFDLAPLYRSTIGFDRLASLIDSMAGLDGESTGYPPYNIERVDDNAYRITIALAGFDDEDLNVEVKENVLTIRGEKTTEKNEGEYLHHGIASRAFERKFQLADYVEVRSAELKNGLLHIDLVREVPEALKPRTIAINQSVNEPRVIEGKTE